MENEENKNNSRQEVNSKPQSMKKKLEELREEIINGKKVNTIELEKIRKEVKRRSIIKPKNGEIEALAQVYVQLDNFSKAKTFVKDMYYCDDNSKEGIILDRINKQELSYEIMRRHMKGDKPSKIAEDLRILTVDAIRAVRNEKEMNNTIKLMKGKEKKSNIEIADKLDINISRIKMGLAYKEIQKENGGEPR